MGDPKATRKKYTTPAHMWQGTRIADELKLKKEYGLKNNREIWRAEAFVRNARQQARKLIGKKDEQAEARKKLLIGRLERLGIISKGTTLADILAINVKNVLTRRLQTILKEKGIAKTMKEARQMIIHGQVKYRGRKHTVPGTLIQIEFENTVAYTGSPRVARPPKRKETVKDSPTIEADVKEEATDESKKGKPAEEPAKEEKPAEESAAKEGKAE